MVVLDYNRSTRHNDHLTLKQSEEQFVIVVINGTEDTYGESEGQRGVVEVRVTTGKGDRGEGVD